MSRRQHDAGRRQRHDSGVSSLSTNSRGGEGANGGANFAGRGRNTPGPSRGGHNSGRGGGGPRISQSHLSRIARVRK